MKKMHLMSQKISKQLSLRHPLKFVGKDYNCNEFLFQLLTRCKVL